MHIQLKSVVKTYGRVKALDGANIDIAEGMKTALVGPNGSGKSTLIRVIMGLISCEGEVSLDGRSPYLRRSSTARETAYSPQSAPRTGATVGEIVKAVSAIRDIERETVVAAAFRLDFDLNAVSSKPVRELSGGMKQKLMLTLAFAAPARLLILDEPTASLDAESRGRFFEEFESITGSATVLLCSHRLEEVRRLVDRVIVLNAGRVAYDGPAADFIRDRSISLIEIHADDPDRFVSQGHGERLTELGFHRGSKGVWTKSVDRAAKLELLETLVSRFDSNSVDVTARDVENYEQ